MPRREFLVKTSLAAAALAINGAARATPDHPLSSHTTETARHRTSWIEVCRRAASGDADQPSPLASIRARGGWFAKGPTPPPPAREALLPEADKQAMLAAFARTGFSGSCAWYLNEARNTAYAAEAPNFGRLSLPALFFHSEWDAVCDTAHSHLADPMREDCADLTEVSIAGGHVLMLEQPAAVNQAVVNWLKAKKLGA